MKNHPIRDLRQYSKQTSFRLIVGGLLLLFIVGGGLIYYTYGGEAAFTGVICILSGLAPILLIALFFWGIDWILHRSNRE